MKPLSNGHFETNINSSGLCPVEVVLVKRFQSHYIDRGIKFGGLVLSIVEWYHPFIGGSSLRGSTVND